MNVLYSMYLILGTSVIFIWRGKENIRSPSLSYWESYTRRQFFLLFSCHLFSPEISFHSLQPEEEEEEEEEEEGKSHESSSFSHAFTDEKLKRSADLRRSCSITPPSWPFYRMIIWEITRLSPLHSPGAPAVVGAAAARCSGDEAGPHLAGLRAVPQDLHPAARERQVRPPRK